MKLKEQIKVMKNFMNTVIDTFFNAHGKDGEDIIDDFYKSYFTFSFYDKRTKQTKTIKIFICPETWEMAENFLKDLDEVIDDYDLEDYED